MGERKKIHIISHTHWDREWYLPYEKHHYLLIKLMDTLLDTLEHNPDYQSFHLDGQTIILDDYLQVRPEKRTIIQRFIDEGRLHIGPWYILQDEFLTSGEANIRNLQYGLKDAKEWGGLTKVGYFPDSFGNIGQAPQLLSQAGINNAVFGRGVKPTGFNNKVVDSDTFESPYSEMIWRSPDGSAVLGVLFANWYCNGNEVPVNEKEAAPYWEERIAAMEKYAATSELLMMNGCDHQPIQTDLPEAIETAQKLYPDIEFLHSSFDDYINRLGTSVPENLKTVDGELRSQQTDGWGTLVNTASSRLYLKQMNRKNEVLLEKVAEPLATFASILGANYNHGLIEYAWKTLMQNHPHDSICGCSVDEVHQEMVTRFEKSKHIGEMLVEESLDYIKDYVDTSVFQQQGTDALPFIVYNTTGQNRTGTVSVTLDVKREYFSEGVNKEKLKSFALGDRIVVDADGNKYECVVEDLGINFAYDLPETKFRQPYMVRRGRVTFYAEKVPALGLKTFAFVKDESDWDTNRSLVTGEHEIENEYLHILINRNGSLTLTDKVNSRVYQDLCVYEDTGDIGNEYMYKQPANEEALTTADVEATVRCVMDTSFKAVYEIIHEWEVPAGANDLLETEKKEVVEFPKRKAVRVERKVPLTFKTYVTLEKDSAGVDIKTTFNNQAKDHRLRALFPTDVETNTHAADSVFEVAERNNEPAAEWTNPDNSQHQQAFVNVSNDIEGLTVANYGLYEYEVLRDSRQTIALTLLRSVGELGDWGHFPTPEAQCLGENTVAFRITPHQGEASKLASYQDAYQCQVPWSVSQTGIQGGIVPPAYAFLSLENSTVSLAFSSLKLSETTGDIIARWFNMTENETTVAVEIPKGYYAAYESNIVEEKINKLNDAERHHAKVSVNKYEVKTIGFEK